MRLVDLQERYSGREIPNLAPQGGKPALKRTRDPIRGLATGIMEYMKERDWHYRNGGHFGGVFVNLQEPDVVLKILPRDTGYLRFYSIAKRSENPHFPEVGKIRTMQIGETPLYGLMIEKLQPYDGRYDEKARPITHGRPFDSYLSLSIVEYIEADDDQNFKVFDRLWPQLRPAVDKVKSVLGARYLHDIGSSNIMWRKGEFPVLIDPLRN